MPFATDHNRIFDEASLFPASFGQTEESDDDEEKAKILKRQELLQQLVNGTNLGDSLLEIINRESNTMVQGIIVVSDGRSTQSSSQAFDELRARARRCFPRQRSPPS